jgi:hypothetical protein
MSGGGEEGADDLEAQRRRFGEIPSSWQKTLGNLVLKISSSGFVFQNESEKQCTAISPNRVGFYTALARKVGLLKTACPQFPRHRLFCTATGTH